MAVDIAEEIRRVGAADLLDAVARAGIAGALAQGEPRGVVAAVEGAVGDSVGGEGQEGDGDVVLFSFCEY